MTTWSTARTPASRAASATRDRAYRTSVLGRRAHAAHVGDEVLGAEVRDGHRWAQELAAPARPPWRSRDRRGRAGARGRRASSAAADGVELLRRLELGHDDAGDLGCDAVGDVGREPLGRHRVHPHVDRELRVRAPPARRRPRGSARARRPCRRRARRPRGRVRRRRAPRAASCGARRACSRARTAGCAGAPVPGSRAVVAAHAGVRCINAFRRARHTSSSCWLKPRCSKVTMP